MNLYPLPKYRHPPINAGLLLNPRNRLNRSLKALMTYTVARFDTAGSSIESPSQEWIKPSRKLYFNGKSWPKSTVYGPSYQSVSGRNLEICTPGDQLIGDGENAAFVCRFMASGNLGCANLMARGKDGYGAGWSVFLYRATDDPKYTATVLYTNPSTTGVGTGNTPTLPFNQVHTLVLNIAQGSGVTLYYDGVASVASAPSGCTNMRSSTWGVSLLGGADSLSPEATYFMAAVYNRTLTASEAYELHYYPWGTPSNPRFLARKANALTIASTTYNAASPSLSPSASPSLSPSGSPSASPSPSISPSHSPSESPSVSPSPSSSPSKSPSGPVESASLSPSASPSISASRSFSISPSFSPSASLSISPSASPSFGPSSSLSPSISPSEPSEIDITGMPFLNHYDGTRRYYWLCTGKNLY